jgi:5-methylcytosine-specific restriction enzyme subunit McrC
LVPITWCQIEVDESVLIQGHRLRFATVDLTTSHADLRARLLQLASLD